MLANKSRLQLQNCLGEIYELRALTHVFPPWICLPAFSNYAAYYVFNKQARTNRLPPTNSHQQIASNKLPPHDRANAKFHEHSVTVSVPRPHLSHSPLPPRAATNKLAITNHHQQTATTQPCKRQVPPTLRHGFRPSPPPFIITPSPTNLYVLSGICPAKKVMWKR